MKRWAWILILMAVAILLAGRTLRRKPEPKEPAALPPAAPPAVFEQAGLTVINGTDFATRYPGSDSPLDDDLKMVAELLDAMGLLVKDLDRFPLPDNAAFTAFLQGKNPHRVAWIRPGHPAVSREGELLDRWGNPLFFHRESSRTTTLRSAGPDGKMWNGDDGIWPHPVPAP